MKKNIYEFIIYLIISVYVIAMSIGMVGCAVTGILYGYAFDLFKLFILIPVCLVPFGVLLFNVIVTLFDLDD